MPCQPRSRSETPNAALELPSGSDPEAAARRVPPADPSPWERRRAQLHGIVSKRRAGWLSREELEAHFAGMPARYWVQVSRADLAWHLKTVHTFLQHVTDADAEATRPVVRWRRLSDRRLTELLVCTWDRHGLLAKVAGAFALARVNIVRAVAYTRRDDVVLDLFEVCDPRSDAVLEETRLQKVALLLEASVSQPLSVSFVATAAPHNARPTVSADPGRAPDPGLIRFHNTSPNNATILEVQAPDRLGLLYEILEVLTDCDLNISHASLNTQHGTARDVFHVTEPTGEKLLEPARLLFVRERLEERLGLQAPVG
jgi:[protein-PII] uridylyltransferase